MKTLLLFAAASVIFAQAPPPLSNAHLETRAFAGDWDAQWRGVGPVWVGYQIKTVQKNDGCCWSDLSRGCWLQGDSAHSGEIHSGRPVALEGSDQAAVLLRVENRQVGKVQVFSMGCPLDAGGLPFVWLTGVSAQASLAELNKLALSNATDRLTDGAVFAISQHDDAQADHILEQLAAASQPEPVREKVAFWLGQARGAAGVKMLRQMLNNDPSAAVRDKVVFALSISSQPEGTAALMETVNTNSSAHVRSQAIFWLAQKAGKQAEAAIVNAIQNDPDTEVKKKAVFALSQLPKDDGVPKLIEVARTQRNAEVRKQAFFWLGQSGDARALAFIEEVLGR
jgi:hypothetical protein